MYSIRSTICECSRLATAPGDKDAEMTDAFVHQTNNDLSVCLEGLGGRIKVGHPVERLLGRRDVVAQRRENDNRRFDRAQVEGAPL